MAFQISCPWFFLHLSLSQMSLTRSLLRPLGKWATPRRPFHSTAVFRATAEQQEEAATQRKFD